MIITESILNDGSTAIFYNKIPVLFYNSMYKKIYVNRDLYSKFRILVENNLDQCYDYDIELRYNQEMIDCVYLINTYDYSKGELAASPIYE